MFMDRYIIAGLGNPERQYAKTRHNAGRMFVETLAKEKSFKDWFFDQKINALKTEGKIRKKKVVLVLPEAYMNKSGGVLGKLITSKKKARRLIVVHDDIDLPIGRFKVSFGSRSAGHKGVASVMRAVRTMDFFRIRIGISLKTRGGRIKKPRKTETVRFLMARFGPKELVVLRKVFKEALAQLEAILSEDNAG
jgi:PTH1 family peptidyl-tRNA hydrolase